MKIEEFKIDDEPPLYITYWIFIVIAGLILPIVLIPLIKFTGYSEIIEETGKLLVILFLIFKLPNYKMQILAGMIFGLLFGLSENFLYFNQIFQTGDFAVFWQRFLWTVPMHIITVLMMVLLGMKKKWLIVFGLIGAVFLHILFNSILVKFLIG